MFQVICYIFVFTKHFCNTLPVLCCYCNNILLTWYFVKKYTNKYKNIDIFKCKYSFILFSPYSISVFVVSWSLSVKYYCLLYSGRTLKWCMTFVPIIRTSKHFWLLQCIWLQTRVTYPWCTTTCSHWNHCILSQELWEDKFLVLKMVCYSLHP